MKLLLLCAAAAAVCGLVVAQVPDPCRAPREFESRVFRTRHHSNFSVMGRMSYDANNMRMRIIDEVIEDDGTRVFLDVIEVYQERKRYIIDLQRKNCSVESMDHDFRPFEVPMNATFSGEAVLGSKGIQHGGVEVMLWRGAIFDDDHYFSVWTLDGCLPIEDYFESRRFGLFHTRFFDMVTGISDPMVFIPPPQCKM